MCNGQQCAAPEAPLVVTDYGLDHAVRLAIDVGLDIRFIIVK
jgi:hypothetical protein